MIYECLKSWTIRNIQLVHNTKIILHTSCVNYRMTDLKNMFSLDFSFVIPEDVYYELRLLTKSKIYGTKALFILEHAQLQPSNVTWTLSQLYQPDFEKIRKSCFFNESLIFVFGDLNKVDEFLKHAVVVGKTYILLPPTTWSCISGNCVVMDLCIAKKYHLRNPKALVQGRPVKKLTSIPCVYLNRKKTAIVMGNQFIPTGKCGSNAHIYTCESIPGTYIKGFKNYSMVGTQKEKLQLLQKFGAMVPEMNCAFPIDLLYDYPASVVGYSMKTIPGKLLREYLVLGWDNHDLGKIFKQLMLILLELHTMHILVNDLSFNNIIIDDFDNIGLVDCDSFQITNYPGGGITKIYQHPEIDDSSFSHQLREPRHEYFAFAVLLFQCLFGDDPLRQVQTASDDTELNWNNAVFAMHTDEYSCVANKKMQKIWFTQPRELRKAFFDEFTYKQDLSIGSWIKVLGILD